MKAIFGTIVLSVIMIACLKAEPVSLVRAAELATRFMESEKIEGRSFPELFAVTALRRIQNPEPVEPTTVVWRVDLQETEVERTSPAMQLSNMENGKRYRRVLEIRQDQSVVLGKVSAEPRPRVVPAVK